MTKLPAKPSPIVGPSDQKHLETMLRIESFLSQRSPGTYETYLGVLKEWTRFLGAEFGTEESSRRLSAATDFHSLSYLQWLSGRPGERPRKVSLSVGREITIENRRAQKKIGLESLQSNATIHKKLAALRRIYRMLLSAGLLVAGNPFDADKLRPPPKDSGRKRPTEMVPMDRVIEVLSEPSDETLKGIQDRAILSCLFGGGLRRSEVVGLKIADVKKTANGTTFLYLRATKAGKDAEQALPDWAALAVLKHLEVRISQRVESGDPLFCSFIGRGGSSPTQLPISTSGVYKLFKLYCKRIGLGREFSPHSARATAITRLLDAGIPHRKVKEFSRHASIQMVEHYDKHRLGVDENPAKDLEYSPAKVVQKEE